MTSEVEALMRRAQKAYGRVLLRRLSQDHDDSDLAHLKNAAGSFRAIMDSMEQGKLFDDAHEMLDRVGESIREYFPDYCLFAFEDGQYLRTCDVDLAHLRVGMSPGFLIRKSECSICRSDPRDCVHVRNEYYDGSRCYRIIKELDLLEISYVERPAQPEARITRIAVMDESIRTSLGDKFKPGMPIRCDKCLRPCRGLTYPTRHARQAFAGVLFSSGR